MFIENPQCASHETRVFHVANLVEEGAEGPRGAKSAQGTQHVSGMCQGSLRACVTFSTPSSSSGLGLQASALVPEDRPCSGCWSARSRLCGCVGSASLCGGGRPCPALHQRGGLDWPKGVWVGISRVSPACLGLQPRGWVDAWLGLKGGGAAVGSCGVGWGEGWG